MASEHFNKGIKKAVSPRGSRSGSHVGQKYIWVRPMAVGLIGILVSLVLWSTVVWAAPRIEAPDFELVTLDGDSYSKESFQGQPTLLVFWAPWCHFCQLELPVLAKFYRENKPGRLRILTIAFADTRANVEVYVKANPETFPFPTAYDTEDRTAQKFGVSATPTFVVMNEQGDLIMAHFGAGLNRNPQYHEFLKGLRK